jgi:hypothetical protein
MVEILLIVIRTPLDAVGIMQTNLLAAILFCAQELLLLVEAIVEIVLSVDVKPTASWTFCHAPTHGQLEPQAQPILPTLPLALWDVLDQLPLLVPPSPMLEGSCKLEMNTIPSL